MWYSSYLRLQDIAMLMYKVKNNMCPAYIALCLNSLQLSINCAIMTSLYPDLTRSPLESTRSGIWDGPKGIEICSQKRERSFHVVLLKNITLEKWILVCYLETIIAQTALFEVLNLIWLWIHLYILCIPSPKVLPNFLFAHTEYILS